MNTEDAVVLEASCGSSHWARRIEETGARCFVLDPMKFRIITDSWNKTDRQDARNMAKALWVFLVTGEFGIPVVYKPIQTIRTLRRSFAACDLLNRQYLPRHTSIKNLTQARCNYIAMRLNTRPRKRRGYRTPLEDHNGRS